MRHIRGLIYCALAFLAAACSSGSEEGSSDDLLNAFTVSGSIGDGPIVGADVTITDADGNIVSTTTSDATATYTVDIPGQTPLPVTVRVEGGTDLVTQRAADFELVAALHTVGEQTVNVSPLTTLAVRAAQCNGAVTPENLDQAWQAMSNDLNMGLDAAALADPMASVIDTTNVETAVLANEAVGEWVRRTGAALQGAGFATSLDEVVEVLACDIADGRMDGATVNAVGSNDARILAVAKAAEVAVRLEVVAGRLEVDNVDATSVMNTAIRSIMPSFTDPDVNSVTLGAEGLEQLIDALAILQGVYTDDELVDFMLLLDGASTGNVRALVDAALTAGPQNTLQGLAGRVSLADSSAIDDIVTRQQQQDDALAPIVSFSADPASIDAGASTTLSWASSNADQCSASGAWSGDRPTDGTFATGPMGNSATFNLACTGVGGVTNASVAVTVADQPQPDAPTVSLSASASLVDAGDVVTLSWSSTDAAACTASGAWSGSRPTSGQMRVGPLQTSASFSLTCSGNGGSASDAVSVTVRSTTPAPTVSLTASASQVDAGDSVTLSWSSSNASSCTASGAWSGARGTTGSASVGPLQSNSSFVLSCSGAGGSASDSVSVIVTPTPVDPPSVSLTASASQVDAGDSVTLSWSSSNASSCSASGGWSGGRSANGQQSVGPLQSNSTFTLTCSNSGGSASDSVSVSVNAANPPTLSFSTNASQVDAGDSVTLTWSATDADSCTASGGWSGARAVSGQETSSGLQSDTTFTLSCDGPGGSVVEMVSVSVVGELVITWQAPSLDVNGDPVDGITTYRIHYGTSSRQYDDIVEVSGSAASHTLNLPMGTYYVAMSAINTRGDESGLSNEIRRDAE